MRKFSVLLLALATTACVTTSSWAATTVCTGVGKVQIEQLVANPTPGFPVLIIPDVQTEADDPSKPAVRQEWNALGSSPDNLMAHCYKGLMDENPSKDVPLPKGKTTRCVFANGELQC